MRVWSVIMEGEIHCAPPQREGGPLLNLGEILPICLSSIRGTDMHTVGDLVQVVVSRRHERCMCTVLSSLISPIPVLSVHA